MFPRHPVFHRACSLAHFITHIHCIKLNASFSGLIISYLRCNIHSCCQLRLEVFQTRTLHPSDLIIFTNNSFVLNKCWFISFQLSGKVKNSWHKELSKRCRAASDLFNRRKSFLFFQKECFDWAPWKSINVWTIWHHTPWHPHFKNISNVLCTGTLIWDLKCCSPCITWFWHTFNNFSNYVFLNTWAYLVGKLRYSVTNYMWLLSHCNIYSYIT